MTDESIVILFSGGTDSTLAAALAAEKFKRVHLVTYDRFGISSVENSRANAQVLIDRYGEDRVDHKIINVDKLFAFVSYESYFKNLIKHGFKNLSTCGLCKLAMHVQTIKYCLDHKVSHVSDGANAGMSMFPAQMDQVITEIRKMYDEFDINYTNPVFDYDAPEEASFISVADVQLLKVGSSTASVLDKREEHEKVGTKGSTAGDALFKMGLAPGPNIKGSDYDKKRQPRCFQFILFNIFAIKYFLAARSYEEYKKETVDFFKEKIGTCLNLLRNSDQKKYKRLFDGNVR